MHVVETAGRVRTGLSFGAGESYKWDDSKNEFDFKGKAQW